ncbi:LPS assembly lipoprotein LptE [Aeromonas schubertii]|uniref:LPS-assembly lipoprotein LptE n=1 Tax=Aeromonas schubertii TaxID=652 RepID=A0ABS7V8X1_9GAMM|nr:LPS assembly lipoprotein LptE [Aeromonas schubertii]MBZ6065497.1 LPS assembly lipoprotein LptE [Aeromonas schubertii]
MSRLMRRWLVVLVAGLLVQACGFHLRGMAIPPELMTMKVVGDNKSDFYRMVTTRLRASGVTLADKEGIPVLTLGGVGSSNQVASVNVQGTEIEYVMGFSTQFTVSAAGKPTQVFPITFNRSFLNKPDAALASSREQEQLIREMQEQAADQVIRQLSQVSF